MSTLREQVQRLEDAAWRVGTCTVPGGIPLYDEETRRLDKARADLIAAVEHAPRMLRAIFAHWNEFGPEHGFGELMQRCEEAFAVHTSPQGEG